MKYTREERLTEYKTLLTPVQANLKTILRTFLQELTTVLKQHSSGTTPADSLQMLDSCVPKFPNGQEKGIYYAVELNGVFVRSVQYKLDNQSSTLVKENQFNIRDSQPVMHEGLIDEHATARELFDKVAQNFKEVVRDSDILERNQLKIGFSISFPLQQKSINHGILKIWTKGFKTGSGTNDPVVGQDVCALLENGLKRQKLNAKVVAAVNPVISVLLEGILLTDPVHRSCKVGMIIGTGFNGGYVQSDAEMYGYQSVLINTELGNFSKCLPRTHIDYEIDFYSGSLGRQILEKMTSELYIGEICRLAILQIFQSEAPIKVWQKHSLSYEGCFIILNDSVFFSQTSKVLKQFWDWNVNSEKSLSMIHEIVKTVFIRSAALVATAIAGLAMATGYLQPSMGGISVAISGIMYVQNPLYQEFVQTYLQLIMPPEILNLICLIPIKDRSTHTVARLAATLQQG